MIACFVRAVITTSGVVRVPSTSLATATTFARSDGATSDNFWSGAVWVLSAVPCSFWIRALFSADGSPEETPRDVQPKAAVGRRWWYVVARWAPLAAVDVTATAAAGSSLKHSLILSLAIALLCSTRWQENLADCATWPLERTGQTWCAGARAYSGVRSQREVQTATLFT